LKRNPAEQRRDSRSLADCALGGCIVPNDRLLFFNSLTHPFTHLLKIDAPSAPDAKTRKSRDRLTSQRLINSFFGNAEILCQLVDGHDSRGQMTRRYESRDGYNSRRPKVPVLFYRSGTSATLSAWRSNRIIKKPRVRHPVTERVRDHCITRRKERSHCLCAAIAVALLR
jgi:hypothetical protein